MKKIKYEKFSDSKVPYTKKSFASVNKDKVEF